MVAAHKKAIRFYLSFLLFWMPFLAFSQYNGSASVTQGLATTIQSNLYPCTNGRITDIGTITALDSSTWTVPADVNFTSAAFPFASDLYNSCSGATYPNDAAALAALNGSDIVNVDPGGELITAYIFADNYFEMYINGVPVGKDNVPYTQFNSNIVRFRVNRPFTIAIMLVDWEEKLGVGCEFSNGFQYHMGDGGLVAVFKDSGNQIIATTGSDWKAQTFYTAPILDLTCPVEVGNERLSGNCGTQDSNNGISYYGLHWPIPFNWMDSNFNDSVFPNASTYTNAVVGVNNKPAYTNFTNIFDDPNNDAQFIWSSNLVLDNLVLTRHTVPLITGTQDQGGVEQYLRIFPNPAGKELHLELSPSGQNDRIRRISIFDESGNIIFDVHDDLRTIPLGGFSSGSYLIKIETSMRKFSRSIIIP